MNILDMHDDNIKLNVSTFGRPVTLTEPNGTIHENLIGRWNDVGYVLKVENYDGGDPMGAKSSIYFDWQSLSIAGIDPAQGWILTGSPNKYDPVKTYFLEIPKIDRELPGKLFFLSEKKTEATAWDEV